MLKKRGLILLVVSGIAICIVSALIGLYIGKSHCEVDNQAIESTEGELIYANNRENESKVSTNLQAKEVADNYCYMLQVKQSNIEDITYLDQLELDDIVYVSYSVEFNTGLTKIGEVTVSKSYDGEYRVTGMDLN
ncbi:MAG: hypothetical protein ACRCW0_05140 [Clostridium sp.]